MRSSAFIKRPRLSYNQTFAPKFLNIFKIFLEKIQIMALVLFDDNNIFLSFYNCSQFFFAIFKVFCRCWQVKYHILDFFPFIIDCNMFSNNTETLLKILSSRPKLTVKWHFWKVFCKPCRSIVSVAQTSDELCSIPIGTNTIKFFAYP